MRVASLKAAAVDKLAAGIAAADAAALVETLLPIIDKAVADDDYEVATRFAKACSGLM